ncbi:MAG TPA: DUF429 domain-containing protein [Burkholderiaceae bacterium]|nr:DUF429 domain-containing protein [Burkholderiaceae bacterium]
MLLHGIDFTSAPTARKPIMIASASFEHGVLRVTSLLPLVTFEAFDDFLAREGPWVGGFDLPFGLPREFIAAAGWPPDWAAIALAVAAMPRESLIAMCRAFCDARPVGGKFAHRATDRPAGSSPSMKWVNPPVLMMYRAGVPRLMRAGLSIPGLLAGDPRRIALEAYPGLLARRLAGRESYKSDEVARHTPARRARRIAIIDGLRRGGATGFEVRLDADVADASIGDGSGDCLDAVLCAAQAAWGWQRHDSGYGLPPAIDPLEGWIVGAPFDERTPVTAFAPEGCTLRVWPG